MTAISFQVDQIYRNLCIFSASAVPCNYGALSQCYNYPCKLQIYCQGHVHYYLSDCEMFACFGSRDLSNLNFQEMENIRRYLVYYFTPPLWNCTVRGYSCMLYIHRQVYHYLEFKLCYLKNLKNLIAITSIRPVLII